MACETARIEEQLRRVLEGGAWHGPAVLEVLDGVSAGQAGSHPIAGSHSIWEIVLHIASDYTLILRRLAGDGHPVTPEEDWPPCPPPTIENWRDDVGMLCQLNRQLREAVLAFPEERLDDPLVPEVPYSAHTQFTGVAQHNLYHAGQIALLKRALSGISLPGPIERTTDVPSEREVLRHYLASIAYHAQKAIRGAPPGFWRFAAGNSVRTPEELLRHMTSVMGYARTYMIGGRYWPEPLATVDDEIVRFHEMLEDVARHLEAGTPLKEITEHQLLQGPFSDVMTHIGQLSLLRRLFGSPVPPENFIYADITPDRLGRDQAEPRRPDTEWPEGPRKGD